MNLTSAAADVKALGLRAPIRAAYELSKKVGGHAVVFRPRPVPDSLAFRPPLKPPTSVPPARVSAALKAADQIVDGSIELFGRSIRVGPNPDWHQVIHQQGRWPVKPWWQIDIRSPARVGDVKWVWELGRHRHLVLLARAAYLNPGEPRYQKALEAHLLSWLEQNPAEVGVHWYSNLEISLRGIAWLQILSLVASRLDRSLVERMQQVLYHSGRHLMADLPYTLSTMRNNHLIGDGLGLVAIGSAFPGDKRARRWTRAGDFLVAQQLRRHFRSDGSSIEDSVSYNRFVLEMLATRVLLGGASKTVVDALLSSAGFLARLGVLTGSLPQFGDWDEGRVLAVSEDPRTLRGSVLLAFALAGTGAPEEWSEQYDEVAWYASSGTPLMPPEPVTDGHDVGGGIGRARSGPWTVWLKAGSGSSHGHADLLSSPILFRDQWIVGDPGTGTYNGPIEQRNYFRSSLAHSVVRLQGEDQLVPHRAFRWRYSATGKLGEPIMVGGYTVMWGVHDAYMRLDTGARVVRAVAMSRDRVITCDWAEKRCEGAISLPLEPDLEFSGGQILGQDVNIRVNTTGTVRSVRGATQPFDGWWSDTYGSMRPSHRVELIGHLPLLVEFSAGTEPSAVLRDARLVAPGLEIGVEFGDAVVTLRAHSSDELLTREVSL